MRSGLESTSNRNYGAWVQSPNWVQHALAGRSSPARHGDGIQHRQHAPAVGDSHEGDGKSTWQFAQDTLAKPLGFTLPRWPQDPQGIYFGGNDMLMTPRQMLAFGELYLRHGRSREAVRPPRSGRPAEVDRAVVRAARGLADQRQAVRLWLVDARPGRTPGVLRLGIRRSVHRPRPRSRSRRRHDLGIHGGRRSTQPSADALRAHRGSHHRARGDGIRRVIQRAATGQCRQCPGGSPCRGRGADLIDAKDPLNGALGAVSLETLGRSMRLSVVDKS